MDKPEYQRVELPVHPSAATVGAVDPGARLSPPWSVAAKSIVAVVWLILFALILWRFQELIRPLVVAAILAYLLNPPIAALMRYAQFSRGLAVVIVYFGMLLLLLVGMTILGFVAFDQVTRLAELLPDSATELVDLVQRQIDAITQWQFTVAGYTFSGEMITRRLDVSALGRQTVALIQPVLSQGGSLAAQLARLTINALTNGFLIFFVSLYMAKDSPQMGQAISNVANMPGYRYDAERLMREFMRIWDAYLRGQVILGIVIGVAVGLCLSLLGVNNALGLGVLSGVLEFLPVIGPVIGAAAAVLVAVFQPENYWGFSPLTYALVVLGVMILIQQIENNFLVPRIVGDALDLHPIVVMVAVIMGASLAGILGAILAAPVAASLNLIGTYTWRKLLDLPPFPDPEPPPKPRRGQSGLAGRWRLWRMRLNLAKKQ